MASNNKKGTLYVKDQKVLLYTRDLLSKQEFRIFNEQFRGKRIVCKNNGLIILNTYKNSDYIRYLLTRFTRNLEVSISVLIPISLFI